ncbi:Protein kinase domain [Dillenia turbinata]|uniref:Protein kinase domain n=1 Tax=Dillenia turbinata TaxID=194707 RepID=A0AAN8VYR0_9MAGN
MRSPAFFCARYANSFFLLSASGFLSFDCGGKDNFTDKLGLAWISDERLILGDTATISVANETRKQYTTLRHFPADDRKYCYTMNVISRARYLVRATFLYGNFDNNNVYPKFDISLGATHWSTIVISDANTIEVRELIFLASDPSVAVCLSNATTGQPFISTLELRQFNGSIYYTEYEDQFYLSVSARINFGADSDAPIRYPDDPFDRLWQSDSLKKANYLVDVAPGTVKVSTHMPIYVNKDEMPPQKVMQTAVVGTNGSLTYRLNLDGFPGNGWAMTYFAEIEELDPGETRKFRLLLPGYPELSKAIVDIRENAQGNYRLYEPGFTNLTLPFVLSFKFGKTSDSTRGPLVNAMEISKYLEKNGGSLDGGIMASLVSRYSSVDWAQEGGDPCLPVRWSWVVCNSDPQPRIISINLSKRNLTGNIPLELAKLTGLVELWLDGNSLTGPIPDFTGCANLKIIHLENNQLSGELPSSLTDLPSLRELYVQNNMLSGTVPSGLLSKNLVFNYTGNANLHKESKRRNHIIIIIGATVGAAVLLFATLVSCLFMHKGEDKSHGQEEMGLPLPPKKLVSSLNDAASEAAHCFTFSEIEDATKKFEKKIGSGGFGVVYYGRLKDGREVAVKVLTNDSYQGKREFSNEVIVLKVSLLYNSTCKYTAISFLSLCPVTRERSINWVKRLEIAEDAAKGIEYLHTGCVPTIIHRDLKSSNILLDKHMRAKVSDFGLSKLAVDGGSHVSSIVRGTVGYLDPEYYISQHLTDKSDVYSFGVILLELISGQEAISSESFGVNCRNIVQWAKLHIESGDIQGIIDPSLGNDYDIQSMWKIAEKALMCVQPHGNMRPPISEVLKEIQDAIAIEREAEAAREGNSDEISRHSMFSSLNIGMGSMDLGATEQHLSFDESIAQPTAR